MKIKIFTVLMALAFISSAFSQTNLNNYKYVIVPNKYEFLKTINQYKLNDLTKFLFEKYGFSTLMEGDNYPDDLIADTCLALKSNLIEDSKLFKTQLQIVLKNCNDKVVFTSQVGETKEKDYEKAYHAALRSAFISIESMNYKFEPKTLNAEIGESSTVQDNIEKEQVIEELKKEIQALKEEKVVEVIRDENKKEENIQVSVVDKTKEMVSSTIEEDAYILYAQAIENGFQLVDSTPKVVYNIKKTSLENVFLVNDIDGTLFNKNGQWILEYYEQGSLKQKLLNIKF